MTARPRNLVVELCGLPGSGKSTVAAVVAARLAGDGALCDIADRAISAAVPPAPRMLRRGASAVATMAAHPRPSTAAATVLRLSGQQRRSDAARLSVQWLALQRIVHRARERPGVHLLEEGFAQTVWSACLRARALDPGALWACLPEPDRADLVVHVDVAPETALERLAGRGSRHSRTQRLAEAEASAELQAGAALLETVVGGCPVRVARVRGDRTDAASTAAEITRAVLELAG